MVYLNLISNSKTASRRAKRSEIWGGGVLASHVWCPFEVIQYGHLFEKILKFDIMAHGKMKNCSEKFLWVIIGAWGSSSTNMRYLSRRSAQGHLSRNGLYLETDGCRAKWFEIWDFGSNCIACEGTFDLVVFKVFLGSFGAHVSNWLLI